MTDRRDAFSERVMEAIRGLPAPTVTSAFLDAVRARSIGGAVSALRVAWHLGTSRYEIAPRARTRALALVVAAILGLAAGSVAAGTAVRVAAGGINELGNVINHQLGVDQQGEASNPTTGPADSSEPTASGDEHAGTDQPGGSGHGDTGQSAQDDRGQQTDDQRTAAATTDSGSPSNVSHGDAGAAAQAGGEGQGSGSGDRRGGGQTDGNGDQTDGNGD
jgi:hypothetical protein